MKPLQQERKRCRLTKQVKWVEAIFAIAKIEDTPYCLVLEMQAPARFQLMQ